MTEREELVRVRVKNGGAANFVGGQKYALKIAAAATADKWEDGSPITRAEFESVLAPAGVFAIEEKGFTADAPGARALPRNEGAEVRKGSR